MWIALHSIHTHKSREEIKNAESDNRQLFGIYRAYEAVSNRKKYETRTENGLAEKVGRICLLWASHFLLLATEW